MESLLAVAPTDVQPSFYRSAAGAEIDLLLTWPSGEHWAIEIKRSSTPKPKRGFYNACEDLQPVRKLLIGSVTERYMLKDGVEVVPLQVAMQMVVEGRGG